MKYTSLYQNIDLSLYFKSFFFIFVYLFF